MEISQWSAFIGLFSFLLVLIITFIFKKRLDRSDLGALAGSFLAGTTIPRAAYLIIYIFLPGSKEEIIPTKLNGFDVYITFAGAALLFLTLVTLWNFLQAAYKKE